MRDPGGLILHRRRVIKKLDNLILRLQPLRARLTKDLTLDAPSDNLHLPLIFLLAKSMGCADLSLSTDLMTCMNIARRIPEANPIDTRTTPVTSDLQSAPENIRTQSGRILRPFTGAQGDALKRKFWDLSWAGYGEVWMSKPIPVTSRGRMSKVLSRRFCIS